MHAIVEELVDLIDQKDWRDDFDEAVRMAHSYKVPSIANIKDLDDYLEFIDELVTWTPRETKANPRTLYDKLVEFYFFLMDCGLCQFMGQLPGYDGIGEGGRDF
jgi:hypothetical protein